MPASSTERAMPVSTPGRLRPLQAMPAPRIIPPITNRGVLFFKVADWRTLQKPMAAMASRWSRPSMGCNRPLAKPVPASWPAWAEAAVAVTIRPVAISNWANAFMMFPYVWFGS